MGAGVGVGVGLGSGVGSGAVVGERVGVAAGGGINTCVLYMKRAGMLWYFMFFMYIFHVLK